MILGFRNVHFPGCMDVDVWMPRTKKGENSEVSQEVTLADITKVYMELIKGPPFEGYHHHFPKKKKTPKSLGSFLHLDLELPKVKVNDFVSFSTRYEMNEDRLQNETWLTVKEDVFPIDYGDFSLLWYFTKGVIHVTPVVTPLIPGWRNTSDRGHPSCEGLPHS